MFKNSAKYVSWNVLFSGLAETVPKQENKWAKNGFKCLQEEVKLPIWRKMNREDFVIIAGLVKDEISASGAVSLWGMANGNIIAMLRECC